MTKKVRKEHASLARVRTRAKRVHRLAARRTPGPELLTLLEYEQVE